MDLWSTLRCKSRVVVVLDVKEENREIGDWKELGVGWWQMARRVLSTQ